MKLVAQNINKKFGDKTVLLDASFEFEQGKIYGLLGRNGAGKTTFFNAINEDLEIESGSFSIVDENGSRKPNSNDIGYVVSTPVVPDFLTAREFVNFFIDVNHREGMASADEYFNYLQIGEEDRDRLLKDFSHGMKNKVQMLVNFIANPAVFLLDEPLTSLDVVVAEEIKNLFRNIKHDHIIIFSTHIMELALSICDEIVILNDKVLTKIDSENLSEEELKDKIISILKGEEDA